MLAIRCKHVRSGNNGIDVNHEYSVEWGRGPRNFTLVYGSSKTEM